MGKLRVAVVGCGDAGQLLHLRALMKYRDLSSVVGVCDTNIATAKEAANKYGVKSAFQTLGELLKSERPDAVSICTPPQEHEATAIEAIEAGCHVLCEKPMALDVDACKRMIGAAERKGVKLCPVHNQRFHPAFLKASEILGSGEMGEALDARITYLIKDATYIKQGHWISPLRGSILNDFSVHQIYLAMALMGKITGVDAEAWKRTDMPWLKHDTYNFKFFGKSFDTSAFVAHKTESWAYCVEITCKRGKVIADILNSTVICDRLNSLKIIHKNLHQASLAKQLIWQSLSTGVRPSRKRWLITHETLIGAFLESIAKGTAPPVTPQEGMEAVRVMGELIEIIESKRTRNPD